LALSESAPAVDVFRRRLPIVISRRPPAETPARSAGTFGQIASRSAHGISARTVRVRLAEATLDGGGGGRRRIIVERWSFLHVAGGEGSAEKDEGQNLHDAGSLTDVLLAVLGSAHFSRPPIVGPECESHWP